MESHNASKLSEALFSTGHRTFSRWQKLLLLLSAILACGLAYLSFYGIDGAIRGYSASVLQHGSAVRGVLAAVVAVIGAGAVGTIVAGKVRPDSGLFAATVALLFFRLQGSSSSYTLLVSNGRPAFLLMASEIALLAGTLLVLYAVIRYMVKKGTLADDAAKDRCELSVEKLDQRVLCAATVAVVMTACMMILCQSSRPGQVIWATLFSAMAGAWCAFRFIPVAPSVWYWAGPLFAGAAGYVYSYFYGWQNAVIGEPAGMLSSLARATPLDYASVGVAGALMGYWIARKQHREREEQAEADASESSHVGNG